MTNITFYSFAQLFPHKYFTARRQIKGGCTLRRRPLLITPCPLLFDQRNRALDAVRQALALEHAVREQRQVDDLFHEPVFAADLAQPLVALIAQRDDLLRQLLAHGFLFGGKLLLFLALGNLLEAVFLGHGRVDLLGDGLRDAFDPKLRGTE